MRTAATAVLALAYGGATLAFALWATLIAEFHCSNVDCAESDWTSTKDAWQWDVVVALALVAGLAGLATLALVLTRRSPRIAAVGLCVHVALVAGVAAILDQSGNFGPIEAAAWFVFLVIPGASLVYLSASRQLAGTRRG